MVFKVITALKNTISTITATSANTEGPRFQEKIGDNQSLGEQKRVLIFTSSNVDYVTTQTPPAKYGVSHLFKASRIFS